MSEIGKGEQFGRNGQQLITVQTEPTERGQVIKETIGQATELILFQVERCQISQTGKIASLQFCEVCIIQNERTYRRQMRHCHNAASGYRHLCHNRVVYCVRAVTHRYPYCL